jgi:DNA-binding transcriptional ArsR family regulator
MDTLQVVAEPRRREILSLIWDDEMAASEIAARFDVTFGAVSQHLTILREAELVTVRKEGNHRLYSADRDALAPYRAILESMWSNTLGRLASTIEEKETK